MMMCNNVTTGASDNVGLGHSFLRHVERTKVICYVIDIAATHQAPNRNPVADYSILLSELEAYRPGLLFLYDISHNSNCAQNKVSPTSRQLLLQTNGISTPPRRSGTWSNCSSL